MNTVKHGQISYGIWRTKPEVVSKRETQFAALKRKQKQDFRGYKQTKHSTADAEHILQN